MLAMSAVKSVDRVDFCDKRGGCSMSNSDPCELERAPKVSKLGRVYVELTELLEPMDDFSGLPPVAMATLAVLNTVLKSLAK